VFGGQSNTVPPLSNSVTQHVRRVVNAAVEGNKKAWDTARRKVSEARKISQGGAACSAPITPCTPATTTPVSIPAYTPESTPMMRVAVSLSPWD
jgi:hypothetical protein